MDDRAGQSPQWRHLLPIPGLVQERAAPSRPLRIVVHIDVGLSIHPGAQHLAWLLITLLTRSTKSVIAAIGLSIEDYLLVPGIDPGSPEGGPSLRAAFGATTHAFGRDAAPVLDAGELDEVDLILQIGPTGTTRWPDASVLHVSASGWTGSVTPNPGDVPPFGPESWNPFGPYVAACLAAGQVYLYARLDGHQLESASLNAWTLGQSITSSDTTIPAEAEDPGEPAVHLDHVLAGVGAVGTALLLTLWAYQTASGIIRAADADTRGVDETNLNRCIPFYWADIGQPKAETVARRLSGQHGLVIEPFFGRAENVVDARTDLISAVDTPEAREALQDRYPASAVQASTSGLRLEMLRVDPTAGTACLRCFNPPREQAPDTEVRAQVADMDDATVAEHAAAVGTDPEQVREWGRAGGCGRIGDALLERLRPSDGSDAQFSVGFASVLAGVLLAGQVIKDALRRDGALPNPVEPLDGHMARFITNFVGPASALRPLRRYARDATCPACQGIRAEIWRRRYVG